MPPTISVAPIHPPAGGTTTSNTKDPAQGPATAPDVGAAPPPAGPNAVGTIPPPPILQQPDARAAAASTAYAQMRDVGRFDPVSSGYLSASGGIDTPGFNADAFESDFYGGPSAFPSRSAQMAYHASKISPEGRATEAFKFRRSFFREVPIPEGANVEQTLLQRDRAYIGQWQAGMAHVTNAGHALFSSSPSADLALGSAVSGGIGSLGMAYGAPQVAIPAMMAGAAFNVMGSTVDFTYSKALEQARLERPRLQAQAMGVDLGKDSDLLREGTEMGFGQAESTWLLKQYYGSAGGRRRDGSMPMNPLAAHLGGVDIGAMAFFQQGGAPGGGAAEKDVNRAMSMAIGTGYETMGLRDSKLTEFLSRIAAATEGMKERGLKIDREGLTDFAASLATAGRGEDVFQGVRGIQTGMRLTNQALGTAQNLMAPYAQLGEAALLSAAAKEGGSAFEVQGRLQKWARDPRKVYEKLSQSGLSKDAMEAYFSSTGATYEESKILASGKLPTGMTKQMEEAGLDVPFFGGKFQAFGGKGATLGKEVAGIEQDVAQALKDLPQVLRDLASVIRSGELNKLSAGQAASGAAGKWQWFMNPLAPQTLGGESETPSDGPQKLYHNLFAM